MSEQTNKTDEIEIRIKEKLDEIENIVNLMRANWNKNTGQKAVQNASNIKYETFR